LFVTTQCIHQPSKRFFANHGLHPKFNIQSVHKVTNPIAKDWAMWLTNVWIQLVFNLEQTQRWYKENVNEHWKEQPNFKVGEQVWFQWQHIKTTRPLEKLDHQMLSPFLIVKQINAMAFQLKLPCFGWKHGICPKSSHTCNHSHIYGINMKKIVQNFFNFHYEIVVHFIELMVSYA
jgi:hypothetical protein